MGDTQAFKAKGIIYDHVISKIDFQEFFVFTCQAFQSLPFVLGGKPVDTGFKFSKHGLSEKSGPDIFDFPI